MQQHLNIINKHKIAFLENVGRVWGQSPQLLEAIRGLEAKDP